MAHFSLIEFVAYKLGAPLRVTKTVGEHLRHGCPLCANDLAVIERLMQANAQQRAAQEAHWDWEASAVALTPSSGAR